ncbi:DUF4407 domain-containing protein [Teredinibacter turnerae]|uniref:DUF4407 domain-containing protein n=1 Tax=Teredinibacter turnerae TaxID=2426 RepID=UPI00037F3047|nr:DUF4407 domain-containing protein [Teredinibacter turnerae]
MDAPVKQETIREPVRLGLINSLLLSVLGVDRKLAAEHWEDGPILTTLALQLVGTFFLLFTLQSAAFYVLSKVVWVACCMGFLSAFLIISTDRILISGDWYLEGEYWHIYHKNPNSPELAKITSKRWAKMLVRYLIGVVISVSIVTIATPALFALEIRTELDKSNLDENKDTIEKLADQRQARKEDYENAKSYQESLKKELDQTVASLANLRNTSLSDPLISQFQSQINDLQERSQKLNDDFRYAKDRESRERYGLTGDVGNDGIEESGKKGCGERCVYWRSKAEQIDEEKENIKLQIGQIQKSIDDQNLRIGVRMEGDLKKLEDQISSLKIQYAGAKENTEIARRAWSEFDQTMLPKVGKEEGLGVSFEKAGLRRVVDAYDDLVSDASSSTTTMLWLLKVFAVFLETIVFTSKIFGTSRNYSCALFERHKAKWA